ncbi:MAG: shikimate dehydrogenase [Bacteroidetes bacterium HGW-Bacteroidetes-4]|jgi:shikimate dehydrogenase|nr:MAG: shikimate dehydrogenase [Bacteroidetes bacterium HGW-Bacteroidetes-4]
MDNYGLVGYPLTQSFSKKYFTQKFASENIQAQYLNFSIESIGEFPEIFEDQIIKGLNVTIPYKEKVLPFIHQLDETAQKVGAVNVVKITYQKDKPRLIGYNSDVYGFELSLKKYLKSHHTRALVLGTGGAAKAVIYVLKKLGIDYKCVSRNTGKGDFVYHELTRRHITDTPLLINTTPLGMFPLIHAFPELPYDAISSVHLAFDLIYNPEETQFMKKCAQQGAVAVNGYEMLVYQAEKAWEIWNS